MNKSTLVKIGVATAALTAAKLVYSRWHENHLDRETGPQVDKTPDVGKPADAFSAKAIQHDLSIGDGA